MTEMCTSDIGALSCFLECFRSQKFLFTVDAVGGMWLYMLAIQFNLVDFCFTHLLMLQP